jgi:hypothetical protein
MMSIQHIDAIAREKGRDVLYVTFLKKPAKKGKSANRSTFDWEESRVRNDLIEWLNQRGIAWVPCAGVANLDFMEAYHGGLYVDLPIDEGSPEFSVFFNYVEFPDGTKNPPALKAYICALEDAQKNSTHDVPGFWDRWAATF